MGLFDNVNKAVANQQQANAEAAKVINMKVVTRESNLNIRKGPGQDYEVIGKAAYGSTVQVLEKTEEKWYHIKTADGVEGYASAGFLEEV